MNWGECMRNFKVLVIIFLLVILAFMQFYLPQSISQRLTSTLKEEVDKSDRLEVDIDSFPAIELLLGRVDNLKFSADNLIIDSLPISNFEGEFKDLRVKKVDGQWLVTGGENTYLNLKFSEEELNQYLASREELDIFDKFKMELLKNKVMMVGDIQFFNATVNIQLAGNFVVKDKDTIVFSSDELAVQNIIIPKSLIEQLKDKLQFEIDFADLPFPVKIEQVKLEEDSLEILGENK
ncbi:hypothetical protein BX659_10134 [Orenia metallireducens]|jgi:hypothetical protein|uniref:DUF2993 domain-containing protein n=3 Tax=Orenia metallireducens TaxID=1413210 RepID=A0A285FYA6_9FIRM|nr:hypothetical protein BX659_10134 [Orenia metallireducens]SNY16073.1 hypothetical protein SAMN06265827_103157 [Orenia metallireducens]